MSANESVTITVTDENFAQEIGEYSGLAMVDFGAAWCGPCRMIAPIVDLLARQYAGRVRIGKLDVDANPQTTARFNVRSLPSILFFRERALVATIVGAAPKSTLERQIEEQLGDTREARVLDPAV